MADTNAKNTLVLDAFANLSKRHSYRNRWICDELWHQAIIKTYPNLQRLVVLTINNPYVSCSQLYVKLDHGITITANKSCRGAYEISSTGLTARGWYKTHSNNPTMSVSHPKMN